MGLRPTHSFHIRQNRWLVPFYSVVTGGEGVFTWQAHGEFIVSSETIRPPVIHQIHGGYFLKVPTTVPSGNNVGEMGGFFHNSLSNEFATKFEHLF